jgi:hypothetical protein
MGCRAVQFMLEDDKWWKRWPSARSNITMDWSIAAELSCDCHGNALRVAIATGQPRFVSYILGTGYFDVNAVSRLEKPVGSALFDAATIGSAEIAEILIRYGAKVNREVGASYPWLNNPFYEACVRGHSRVVELLLHHKVYVHEFPGCLQTACRAKRVGVVAALLRWRRRGSAYHRKTLPLRGCVKAIRSEGNICEFLRHADEEAKQPGRGWGDYHRAVAILELLIEAGVRHKEECDCGRSDWVRGHHVLGWSLHRERAERENQRRYSTATEPVLETKGTRSVDPRVQSSRGEQKCNCEYCIHRAKVREEQIEACQYCEDMSAESQALAAIEEGLREQDAKPLETSNSNIRRREDCSGRSAGNQDEYSLWRTNDGLYLDPRGWYWESPEAYLRSEPWHPTWRTIRQLGSQYRCR